MAEHNDLGRWGEDLAVQKLISEGCAIVERNWQNKTAEVDIIAMRGNALVFCEVKTRRPDSVDPFDALTLKKLRQMMRAAHSYVRSHNLPHEIQFDFFAIVGAPGSADYTLEHIPDMTMPLIAGKD